MAVGLTELPALLPVAGVRIGVASAGIKKAGRRDLVVMELATGTQTAAVFTQNAFCAAPVIVAKEHLGRGMPRYLLINTGNANAGTGAQGLEDAHACCRSLAASAGYAEQDVLPFSTGVIGEPLPVGKIEAALPVALASLRDDGWQDAAYGIMTTDTVPKGISRRLELAGGAITITGVAKGAGMIRPDMATMLAFIATDAAVEGAVLQSCLRAAVDRSFNRITVDGDTSTNDSCLLVATGRSSVQITAGSPDHECFCEAVSAICEQLAQAIVRDGEGATKFITIDVVGGGKPGECEQVAYAVAHSPLVKTAFFASDPNWGRILAAVGRAGVRGLDVERITIHLDDVCIVRHGGRAPDYVEADGQRVMGQEEITVRIDLGRGSAATRVWTTDFSYDYVRINAEYRT